MQATLDLALDLNCEFANFYSAMAYPGSPLYTLAVRQGVAAADVDRLFAALRDCLPLPTNHLTARKCCDSATRRFSYYANPGISV